MSTGETNEKKVFTILIFGSKQISYTTKHVNLQNV